MFQSWRNKRGSEECPEILLEELGLVLRQAAANAGRFHSIANRCTTAHRDKMIMASPEPTEGSTYVYI